MTPLLLATLKICVVALLVAIGMRSRMSDLAYLYREPGLLLRSLLAMYLLVPLLAVAFVRLLDLPAGLDVALLIMAISAGAPLLPRNLMRVHRDEYVFGLVVTASLLAIVTVPASLAILARFFGRAVALGPLDVARLIGRAFFLPLLAGMTVRAVLPRVAEWTAGRLLAAAGVAMTLCALTLLVLHRDVFVTIGGQPLLVLVAMSAGALAIGHLCGGPQADGRTVLAVACTSRHVGVATLIAASLNEPRAAVLVAAYVVAAALVTLPYLGMRLRQTA